MRNEKQNSRFTVDVKCSRRLGADTRPRRNVVFETSSWGECQSIASKRRFRDIQIGRVALAVFLIGAQIFGTQSGWAASPPATPPPAAAAPAPKNPNAKLEKTSVKCEEACKEFSSVVTDGDATESQIKQFVSQKCGNEPTPAEIEDDQKRVESGKQSRVAIYKECDSAARSRFKSLGPYCMAKSANTTAKGTYKQQAITYTGAAAACAAACAWPAAEGLCQAAGVGTALSEVMGLVTMATEGNLTAQFQDATAASTFGTLGTGVLIGGGVGGTTALAGAMVSKEALKKGGEEGIKKATEEAAKEAGEKAAKESLEAATKQAGEKGLDEAGKMAAEKTAKEAGEKAAKKIGEEGLSEAGKDAARKAGEEKAKDEGAKKLASCASAIIMGATAAFKWVGFGVAIDGEESACKSVEGLQSTTYNGSFVTAEGQKGTEAAGSLNAEIKATTGAKNAGTAGGEKTKSAGGFEGAIAQTMKHEANAGPNSPGGLLKKLQPGTLADRMKAAGLNPNKIASEVEAGKSTADILSGMSGMPSGLVAAMRGTEKAVREGRAGWGGLAGTSYAGGAKAAAPATAAKANPFSFGAFGGAAAAPKVGELNFAAKKEKSLLPNDGDVFHEKFKGSLFDIISLKLDQNRTKVEQMEWQTPLNRAIVGLPPLSRVPAAK